jgi:threonine dehydrogenase-like Zn-dependent dehydrogenase
MKVAAMLGDGRGGLVGEYIHCQHNLNVEEVTGNTAGTATYAHYVVKQDWLLIPIPDDISYEHASMACCGLGPTFNAGQLMQVDTFDTVLITGMGPVGLEGAGGLGTASHWQLRQNCSLSLGIG